MVSRAPVAMFPTAINEPLTNLETKAAFTFSWRLYLQTAGAVTGHESFSQTLHVIDLTLALALVQ